MKAAYNDLMKPEQGQFRTESVRQGSERKSSLLVLDGDDTLWETMSLYRDAKEQFYSLIESIGLDPNAARELFDKVDSSNVPRMGFGRTRFPGSMAETYQILAKGMGRDTDPDVTAHCVRIGASVFARPVKAYPEAREVLEELRNRYTIVLVTKGDPDIQMRRVRESNLGDLFDDIVVVRDKSSAVLGAIIEKHGSTPARAWMVGNSRRSDVVPAIEAGMHVVWIPRNTWIHEDSFDTATGDVVACESLHDLRKVLP